jgi:oligopeptide/dipeptide ABC transporter ATP-binding protein
VNESLLRVEHLVKHFPIRGQGLFGSRQSVRAVDDVSLEVRRGETLGLVGETGCGKSTLARCIIRLENPTSGRVIFDGHDITAASDEELRPYRQRIQMVFQDPYSSLNPRRRVGSIIGDPFEIHGIASGVERKRRVQELMDLVGLNPEHYNRFPSQFSGGQRQRIGIARAIALRPSLLVCDEPVSALDVSIRAQILNLLADLQEELGLTILFISHDLSVVRHVSVRIAVMYLGKVVEIASSQDLFEHARHPYTRALLSAIPIADPDLDAAREQIVLSGDPPSPIEPPPGCHFHPRCPRAESICAVEEPLLTTRLSDTADHPAACHFPVKDGEPIALSGKPS